MKFDEIFVGVGRLASKSWVDFGDDTDHDVDTENFNNFFTVVVYEQRWVAPKVKR